MFLQVILIVFVVVLSFILISIFINFNSQASLLEGGNNDNKKQSGKEIIF